MRNIVFGMALLGVVTVGTAAQAGSLSAQEATVQPVYWNGDYCGLRCREHRWWRHEHWEARRHWHHRRWEERQYGYYGPRRF